MKLPKGFGGQGFGGMLKQAQDAMARAQELERELASERIPVKQEMADAVFDGTGQLQSISLNPAIVDPDDLDGLHAAIVAIVKQGFEEATKRRNDKVQEIMPNIPGL